MRKVLVLLMVLGIVGVLAGTALAEHSIIDPFGGGAKTLEHGDIGPLEHGTIDTDSVQVAR